VTDPQQFPCPVCPRPLALTPQTLAELWRAGWRPGQEVRVVHSCGRGVDFTPWPAEGILVPWRWVRVVGEVA
jgi:hypothetical protein